MSQSETGGSLLASLEQMARAFEAWESDFRANPQEFMSGGACAAAGVSELSANRAAYFYELLISCAGTVKTEGEKLAGA
jgi:hypothetical protein